MATYQSPADEMLIFILPSGELSAPLTKAEIFFQMQTGTLFGETLGRYSGVADAEWLPLRDLITEEDRTAIIAAAQAKERERIHEVDVAPQPSVETAKRMARREYLDRVREESCYAELRGIIDIVVLLLVLADIVGVMLMCSAASSSGMVVVIGAGVLSLALIVAIRQGLLLVIDIADCTIAAGRRDALEKANS